MRTVYDISGTTISITTFTLYGSQKKEKQRRDWKCIWGNDTWKLPKLEKGNTYPGTKSMCMHASSLQSGPTLCNPMDYSPPVSSVHGILQARILEWGAMPISSQPRGWMSLVSPTLAGRFLTTSTTWEAWDFWYMLFAKLLRLVWLFEASWTIAWQALRWTLLRPSKSQGSLKLDHPLQSLVD